MQVPLDHLRIDCLLRVRSVGEKDMSVRVGRAECSHYKGIFAKSDLLMTADSSTISQTMEEKQFLRDIVRRYLTVFASHSIKWRMIFFKWCIISFK